MSNASNEFVNGFNSWAPYAPYALAMVGALVLLGLARGVRS
jgi:hypothetical protein